MYKKIKILNKNFNLILGSVERKVQEETVVRFFTLLQVKRNFAKLLLKTAFDNLRSLFFEVFDIMKLLFNKKKKNILKTQYGI